MNAGRAFVLAGAALAFACGGSAPPPHAAHGAAPPPHAAHGHAAHAMQSDASHASAAPDSRIEQALDEVARVHGAPGPWAVAGYRMSEYALAKLGLSRGSFDLEVVHTSPREVQLSCIADGAAAHSGASLGKLNLSLAPAADAEVVTTFRHRKTGEAIALRPSPAFRARYTNAPRDQARALGREVMSLPDADIFEEAR